LLKQYIIQIKNTHIRTTKLLSYILLGLRTPQGFRGFRLHLIKTELLISGINFCGAGDTPFWALRLIVFFVYELENVFSPSNTSLHLCAIRGSIISMDYQPCMYVFIYKGWAMKSGPCAATFKTINHASLLIRRNETFLSLSLSLFFFFRFWVLTEVSPKIVVFWDVMPCNLIDLYWRFGGMCHYVHDWSPWILKAAGSSDTLASIYQNTRSHNPEDQHLWLLFTSCSQPPRSAYPLCSITSSPRARIGRI
jgi:hypothetical protein